MSLRLYHLWNHCLLVDTAKGHTPWLTFLLPYVLIWEPPPLFILFFLFSSLENLPPSFLLYRYYPINYLWLSTTFLTNLLLRISLWGKIVLRGTTRSDGSLPRANRPKAYCQPELVGQTFDQTGVHTLAKNALIILFFPKDLFSARVLIEWLWKSQSSVW